MTLDIHLKSECPGKDMRYKCPKCEMTSSKGQSYHEQNECKFSTKNIKETAQAFNSLIYKKPTLETKSKKSKINIGLRSSKSVKTVDTSDPNAVKPE